MILFYLEKIVWTKSGATAARDMRCSVPALQRRLTAVDDQTRLFVFLPK